MVEGGGILQAIHGGFTGVEDPPGVVDQDVEALIFALELLSKFADVGLRGEVGEQQVKVFIVGLAADLL